MTTLAELNKEKSLLLKEINFLFQSPRLSDSDKKEIVAQIKKIRDSLVEISLKIE